MATNSSIDRGVLREQDSDLDNIKFARPFRGRNRDQWESAFRALWRCALSEPDVCIADIEAISQEALHAVTRPKPVNRRERTERPLERAKPIGAGNRLGPAMKRAKRGTVGAGMHHPTIS